MQLSSDPRVVPRSCPNAMLSGKGKELSSGPAAGVAAAALYAELRRVSRELPATATLPDRVSSQQPGDLNVLTIGRHRLNSVQLDCTRVPTLLSRPHAEIKLRADGVHCVADNNTRKGTYLDGNRIPQEPWPLKHGDVIAFGGPANVRPPFSFPSTRPASLPARHSRFFPVSSSVAQVLRDGGKTLRNSFRSEYVRPLDQEQWRSAMAAMGGQPSGSGGNVNRSEIAARASAMECGIKHERESAGAPQGHPVEPWQICSRHFI